MTGLSFAVLREANERRLPEFGAAFPDAEGDANWTPNDWAVATAGELGELCNLLKKIRRGQRIPAAKVRQELADTQIYLDLLARQLGVDLGQATIDTFNAKSDELGLKTHIAGGPWGSNATVHPLAEAAAANGGRL